MKNMRLILAFEFSLILILAGCGAKKASCSPESLKAPELVSPDNKSVEGISPSLTWSYPDATCTPEKYRVYLAIDPYYREDMGAKTTPIGAGGLWTPAKPLEPGRAYRWSVSAISGGKEGPKSYEKVFYTGPTCKADELIAPTLIEPRNGDSFFTKTRNFRWTYGGGCIPDGYVIKLDYHGREPFSAEFEKKTGDAEGKYVYSDAVTTPCEKYQWSVAAMVGKTIGPYSDSYEFIEYSGTTSGQVCRDAPPAPTPYVPSPTPIEVGSTLISARFAETGNCRSGPGTLYSLLVIMDAGTTVQVSGRNADGSWLQVMRPDGGGDCWAGVSLFELGTDFSSLPVVYVAPPAPTATSVQGCYVVNQVTQNLECVVPCPANAQPGGACSP
jgi:hypothetical protein